MRVVSCVQPLIFCDTISDQNGKMYDPPFVAHLTILLLYCWDFPPLGVVVVVVCEGGGGRDDCGKDWSDFCI